MISNIFQYLEKVKGKKIPLEYKIINRLSINKEDLFIDGDLNLYDSDIECLPEGLYINGDLILTFSHINSFPDDILISKNLYLHFTILADHIKDDIYLRLKIQSSVKGIIYS